LPLAELRSASPSGFTWHLSVVDAGQPRQNGVDLNGPFYFTSALKRVTAWDGAVVNEACWQLEGREESASLGMAGAIPVSGDFNGDGVDEVGVFYQGEWFIDVNGNGVWDEGDLWAKLGDEKDRPVVGDWDGDGKDDIGIFGPIWVRDPIAIQHDPGLPDPHNPRRGKPKNLPPQIEEATDGVRSMQLSQQGTPRHDLIDHVFLYGQKGDVPVAGDWNGDGITAIGVFRQGRWQLDTNGDGRFTSDDKEVVFGQAGDRPVVGDFNGNGVEDLGVYRNGTWILDTNGNRQIDANDKVFQLGGADDTPVVGDWNGDGIDEAGLYRAAATARVAAKPQD
jgi:hypothetical protein